VTRWWRWKGCNSGFYVAGHSRRMRGFVPHSTCFRIIIQENYETPSNPVNLWLISQQQRGPPYVPRNGAVMNGARNMFHVGYQLTKTVVSIAKSRHCPSRYPPRSRLELDSPQAHPDPQLARFSIHRRSADRMRLHTRGRKTPLSRFWW
jgi:hypothetical protein